MGLLRKISDMIFVPTCHLCGRELSGGGYICSGCKSSMARTGYHRLADNPMERRFLGLFPMGRATGHFFYSRGSDVSKVIHDFKYHKFAGLAVFMGELMGEELLSTGFFSDIDVIQPIPMHYLKQAVRGYNQTEKIAEGLSGVTGLPVSDNLESRKMHRTQTSKTLEERLSNISGIFHVRAPEELGSRHILLVDDVCTTGATLSEAAIMLARSVEDVRISLLTVGVTF